MLIPENLDSYSHRELLDLINSLQKKVNEIEFQLHDSQQLLETKSQEQILQKSENKKLKLLNSEIIDSSPIGFLLIDSVGVLLEANKVVSLMLGLNDNYFQIGNNLLQDELLSSLGLSIAMEQALENKKFLEFKNLKYFVEKFNEQRYFNIYINPLVNENNDVTRLIFMIENITEQVFLRKKIQKNERKKLMESLATGISCELKMPLTVMGLDIDFLEENIGDDSPLTDYVFSIKKELNILNQISEQLANLSSVKNKIKEKFLVSEIWNCHPFEILLNNIEKKEIRLEKNFDDQGIKIFGSRYLFIESLLHLLTNSAEAINHENGFIKFNSRKIEIKNKVYLEIEIKDNGCGIDEKDLPKIFDPFFTTKEQKSGLGLMVVYSTISEFGGHIGIKSELKKGTEIKILFPTEEEK